jgi:hypothetical protein
LAVVVGLLAINAACSLQTRGANPDGSTQAAGEWLTIDEIAAELAGKPLYARKP